MSHYLRRVCWLLAAVLLATPLALKLSHTAAQPQSVMPHATRPLRLAAHDDHEDRKTQLTRDQIAREAWLWHALNQQQLTQSHSLGATALTKEIPNQDINDIAVIQADNRLVVDPKIFDLNARTVQFTPSGAGYTISSSAAAFDNNLGTKLDLTTGAAVNPKAGAEPGDDAYLSQDLGFSFSFFGNSFSTVAISSNGNLAFRPAGIPQQDFNLAAVSSIASLAEFQGGLPRIAPYWHDLDARASVTQGATAFTCAATVTASSSPGTTSAISPTIQQ